MRKLLVILFMVSGTAFAQHLPLQSHYMFNGVALNPAFTGSENTFSLVGSYSNQWVGIEGAPTTQYITAHAPLKKIKSAIGMQLYSDRIGVDRNTGIFGNYAYKILLDNASLTFGLSGGVVLRRSIFSELAVVDNGDEVISENSPLGVLPDFSFGTHYHTNKAFVSFALPMFLSHKFENNKFYMRNEFSNYNFTFGGGYLVKVNPKVHLKPSTLIKYRANNKIQFDFNLMAEFNKSVSLGISYRTQESIIGLLKLKLSEQFYLMYSYGININNLVYYNKGSHEVSLKYNFRYKTSASNPRFLAW